MCIDDKKSYNNGLDAHNGKSKVTLKAYIQPQNSTIAQEKAKYVIITCQISSNLSLNTYLHVECVEIVIAIPAPKSSHC